MIDYHKKKYNDNKPGLLLYIAVLSTSTFFIITLLEVLK